MLSSGYFLGVLILYAIFSEHAVCCIFTPAYKDGIDGMFRKSGV